MDRCLQLQCRTDATGAENRADHLAPTAVFPNPPRSRRGDFALLPPGRHRRHRLLAHGLWPLNGRHDTGAHFQTAQ